MTELTPEKRAELRKLAESYRDAVRAASQPASAFPDLAAIEAACRRRHDVAQMYQLSSTPAVVLSLLDALDAKEAALTEPKRALRKFVPSTRDDRYCRNCEGLRQDHYSGPFAEPDTVYCSKYFVPQKENQR